MADKTGMARVVDLLEKLSLDFQALRYLYKESESRWAVHLNGYRRANRDRVAQMFDEVRATIQNTSHSDPTADSLVSILERVMEP
jgi:hypothetical protein